MASSKKKGTRGASRKSKYRDDPVDDEEEFVQTFDVAEKLRSKDFPRFFIKELLGTEVTYHKFYMTMSHTITNHLSRNLMKYIYFLVRCY